MKFIAPRHSGARAKRAVPSAASGTTATAKVASSMDAAPAGDVQRSGKSSKASRTREEVERVGVCHVGVERGPVAQAESSQHRNAHGDTSRRLSAPTRFKLLRFWNNEVLANIDSVCGATASALVDPIALPFFLSLGRT